MTLGDRLVVMCEGVVQQIDSPTRIYSHPVNRFVAGFVGTPSMNFIEGRLEDGGSFVTGDSTIVLDPGFSSGHAGEVVLGVRPGALHPSEEGRGWKCRLAAVEHLGDRVDLVLEFCGVQLVSRVESTRSFQEGSTLWVEPRVGEGVHLFERSKEGRTLASA